MALTFSRTFGDGAERVTAGTGEPEELPGRFALAGLADAHAHPTEDPSVLARPAAVVVRGTRVR